MESCTVSSNTQRKNEENQKMIAAKLEEGFNIDITYKKGKQKDNCAYCLDHTTWQFYSRELKTCTRMFILGLFIITPN